MLIHCSSLNNPPKMVHRSTLISSNKNDVVVIHNHPNSGRPSYSDIKTLFNTKENGYNSNISSSVVLGHDGSVYF